MYTSTQRERPAGISSGSIDALRVQLMKMNSQQLQAFATANQDDAIKLGLAAEADKYKKQHAQEYAALMSGQQAQPPVAQQILQSIGQPPQQPQQPQQPMPPQGQGMPPQGMPPQGMPPQGMPPQQMAQGQMPPQGMADGGYVLPEDQGIATLPVGNMDFADGGIVAFGGGGDVPGYAGGVYVDPLAEYLKQIGMSAQEFIAKNGNEQQKIRAAAAAAKPVVPPSAVPVAQAAVSTPVKSSGLSSLSKAAAPLAAITDLMYPSNEAEKKASLPYKLGAASAVDERNTKLAAANENPETYAARKVAEMEAAAGKQLSPDIRNTAMSKFVKEKIADNVSKGASFTTDSKYAPTPADNAVPTAGQDGTQPALVAPAPNNSITAYEEGLNKLLKAPGINAKKYSFTPAEIADITPASFSKMLTDAMGPEPAKDPFAPQQEALNKANIATRTNQKAALEADIAKQGEAFTKALDNITKKEARINTMDERNLNMALLEAGLAMMSGDSPNALVNIGKGAQVGTKKYAEGRAQIEAARDRLDDTKMKIEEYRRNEVNMNAREKRAAQAEIDNAIRDGAQATLNGAMKAYDLNRQQGLSFISNSLTLKQFNVNAKNQAASQSMQAQLQADIAADAKKTQFGLAALDLNYKKANPPAGSLEFYKQLGTNPQAKAGLAAYSESLGPTGKNTESLLLEWQKKSPIEKQIARKSDPTGSAFLDRLLQERVLQGSITDKPAGSLLDKQ